MGFKIMVIKMLAMIRSANAKLYYRFYQRESVFNPVTA